MFPLFQGYVSQISIWATALTANDHAALMGGPLLLPPSPPPSPPAPPPSPPQLRTNYGQATSDNPPLVIVSVVGEPETFIEYNGYCSTEYKEQDSAAVAFRAADGTIFVNAGNEQGNVRGGSKPTLFGSF